jgi:hypothetical protein
LASSISAIDWPVAAADRAGLAAQLDRLAQQQCFALL